MFAARGIAVSFSVFAIVYVALSLGVCRTWQRIWMRAHGQSARRMADLLFALRILPLVVATVVTAAFTVPSFVLLEPRAIDEPMRLVPLILGVCGVCLGIAGIVNAGGALLQAARSIDAWTTGAQPIITAAPVPVLRVSGAVPPMVVTGIVRPQVLLSSQAEVVLTVNELRIALNHELVHVRRRDNLKKLLLRFAAFPGMGELESAWVEMTEMASDDAAVLNAREALDLAAALVKVSRLATLEAPIELTVALVRGPATGMNARVERLISWSAPRRNRGNAIWYGVAGVGVVAVFVATYGELLVGMHVVTEWLVR
jgi:hypothetical protein